ncbi:MAG: RecQ family ATP-dependent DNA helicase [Bacteroidetes bacterium]|nr:MAG: RecQ family ATP-dependent DNA helicase [Bacteroidota bacterium]
MLSGKPLSVLKPDIHDILKQYWGYDTFRPQQEEIIRSVLASNDTLALLPTGGGKSVCFQVPGLALDGLTIIVSPLVALMKDQVENLLQRDIPATAIHSGMSFREMDIELDNCIFGKYRFLYVSPERLQTDLFIARAIQMPVKLIAVDEAHCISQWGYDFRPEYLKIGELRAHFPHVPVIAVTATATPDVVDDIQLQLKFAAPNVFQSGFGRDNLHYLVLDEENKMQRLLSIIQKTAGSGIVYVRSRYQTQQIAKFITQNKISATYYHAGLSHADRDKRQAEWTNNTTRVIVATNAFGMGIDKPDVRFVVHMDVPDTLENYFQEAGRAGRDGQKAYCALLYSPADGVEAVEKYEQQRVSAEDAKKVLKLMHNYLNIADGSGDGVSHDFDLQAFATKYNTQATHVYNTIKVLEQQGIVSFTENIYVPPKIKFLVDNYTLYEYQIKYPVMTEFVKVILRSYGGAFENYVPINESELARRVNLKRDEVVKGLARLQQNGIIDYRPQKELPQLVLNYPRGGELIDGKSIEQRATLLKQKLQAVINYCAQTQKCRQRKLLEYFGEHTSADCGKCDVCIETRKKITSSNEFEEYRTIIENVLTQGPVQLTAFASATGIQHQTQLTDALRKMAESGLLTIKDGWVHLNGK